jgi:hypothetical protein
MPMAGIPDPYSDSAYFPFENQPMHEFDAFREMWKRGTPLDDLYRDGPFTLRGPVGLYKENQRGDVAKVQSLLHDVGYFDANETDGPTGIYAKALMDESIRKFQDDHGLAADGYLEPDGETIGQLETLLGEHTRQNPFNVIRLDEVSADPDVGGPSESTPGGTQVANKAKPIQELFRAAPIIIDQIQQRLKPRQPLPDTGPGNAIPPSPAQPPIPPSEMQTPGFSAKPPFDPNEQKNKKPIEPIVVHGTRFPITADSKPQIYIFPDLSDEIEQILIVENRRGNDGTKAELDAVRDWLLKLNPDWEHFEGGRDIFGKQKKETYVPSPAKDFKGDGRQGSIYPDLTFRKKGTDDVFAYVQTVDVDKNGKPTAEELDVAERLVKRLDAPVILIPKRSQMR